MCCQCSSIQWLAGLNLRNTENKGQRKVATLWKWTVCGKEVKEVKRVKKTSWGKVLACRQMRRHWDREKEQPYKESESTKETEGKINPKETTRWFDNSTSHWFALLWCWNYFSKSIDGSPTQPHRTSDAWLIVIYNNKKARDMLDEEDVETHYFLLETASSLTIFIIPSKKELRIY